MSDKPRLYERQPGDRPPATPNPKHTPALPVTEAGHPVYPEGPMCNPHCPGEWSIYHDGYADGYEMAEAVQARDGELLAENHRLRTEVTRQYNAGRQARDGELLAFVEFVRDWSHDCIDADEESLYGFDKIERDARALLKGD